MISCFLFWPTLSESISKGLYFRRGSAPYLRGRNAAWRRPGRALTDRPCWVSLSQSISRQSHPFCPIILLHECSHFIKYKHKIGSAPWVFRSSIQRLLSHIKLWSNKFVVLFSSKPIFCYRVVGLDILWFMGKESSFFFPLSSTCGVQCLVYKFALSWCLLNQL